MHFIKKSRPFQKILTLTLIVTDILKRKWKDFLARLERLKNINTIMIGNIILNKYL